MLLAKTLTSSTFRLALIAIGTFGVIVSAIFSYVYLSTSSYVRSRSDRTIVIEYLSLKSTYERSGRDGLVAVIQQRIADRSFADDVYLLADPSLTAEGQFTPYSSDSRMFSALVPNTWTFAEELADVVFRPQQGQQTIVVRTAATRSALGQETPSGYVTTFSSTEVVCGYTGQLIEYTRSGAAPQPTPSPNGSASTRLADYADIRLKFDATHVMEIAFNYAGKDQLVDFQNFYNSVTFPFPQCEAPAATPPPA